MKALTLAIALTLAGCASQPTGGAFERGVAMVCPTLNLATELTAAILAVPTGYDTTTADLAISLMTLSPCYEIYTDE